MTHPAGCICPACRRVAPEGLLGLPPCPVTGCDNCGSKTTDEDISWTQKGYGCSRCRTDNPLEMLVQLARLTTENKRFRVALEEISVIGPFPSAETAQISARLAADALAGEVPRGE